MVYRTRRLLLVAAFAAACAVSEPEPSGPCDNDGDCIASEACSAGVCTRRVNKGPCLDEDGDGFGVGETGDCEACRQRGLCEEDCDDENGSRNPGAVELCDGVDNDCDDEVDEPQNCESVSDCEAHASLLPGCTDEVCVYLPPNQEPAGCSEPVICFEGERSASPACL